MAPAAHIKLAFPRAGQLEPPLPGPDGPRPTLIRTYTPRRFNPSVPELDVDVALHGGVPVAAWAAQARPGQALLLGGPGAGWFLLAGARARTLLEVVDADEERPLATAAARHHLAAPRA